MAPKYLEVEGILRNRVRELAVGTKLASVDALHKELGVSQGTIARAIRTLVSEGLLEHRLNCGAFVSRPGRASRNIAVLWPDIVEQIAMEPLSNHPYNAAILNGIQAEAEAQGRTLIIKTAQSGVESLFSNDGGRLAGVILLFSYDHEYAEACRAQSIPAVLVDPLGRRQGMPFVTSDHCADMRDAVKQLIAMGHRRIAHISVLHHHRLPRLPENAPVANFVRDERIRGYREALTHAGLEEQFHVHYAPSGEWTPADNRALVEMLRQRQTTACCCFNDQIAARVMRACYNARIHIPGDLSIIGHDDLALAANTTPPLSTIHVPLDEMGRSALRLLDEIIESDTLDGHGVILPSTLVLRESIASPR